MERLIDGGYWHLFESASRDDGDESATGQRLDHAIIRLASARTATADSEPNVSGG